MVGLSIWDWFCRLFLMRPFFINYYIGITFTTNLQLTLGWSQMVYFMLLVGLQQLVVCLCSLIFAGETHYGSRDGGEAFYLVEVHSSYTTAQSNTSYCGYIKFVMWKMYLSMTLYGTYWLL